MPASMWPMAGLLVWAACVSATFVCDGNVQITQSWDGKPIEGHCDGEYVGTDFMPGDRVPFETGPKLSGTLPAKLSDNDFIQTLWLKNNLISGTLPPEWSKLAETLQELDLSADRLSGTIPTEYGLLTELTTEFNLYYNTISGTIPTELGLLTKLTTALNLNGNMISGTVPTQLAALSKLAALRVDGNTISGTVPPGVMLDAALHPNFRPEPPNSPPSLSPSTPAAAAGVSDSDSGGSRRSGAAIGGILSAAVGLLLVLCG